MDGGSRLRSPVSRLVAARDRYGEGTVVASDVQGPEGAGADQAKVNAEVWSRGDLLEKYASTELREAEARILERRRGELGGRVLELGCGAGRLTGHVLGIAGSLHGIDVSPAMVAYCRETYPEGEFSVGDLLELERFAEEEFDAVLAPYNVLDVLDDAQRRSVLVEIRRLLVPGGLLIFSTHNLAYVPSITPAGRIDPSSPRRLAASLVHRRRRRRNHRALAPLQRTEADYAIVNDEAHNFSLLHYYISPEAQARQLADCGFALLECLDLDGGAVTASESAPGCSELHYVARADAEPPGSPAAPPGASAAS